MMKQTLLRRLTIALALVAGFGLPTAFAGGGGGGTGPGVPSSGDDVTTLPSAVADGNSGTLLVGSPLELERLVRNFRGTGSMRVTHQTNGELAVAFLGDWNLRLRRSVLETSSVRIAFSAGATFADGSARLVFGDAKPISFLLSTPTLDLPLAALARSGQDGIGLDFTVVGEGGLAQRNVALFSENTVALLQRTSF